MTNDKTTEQPDDARRKALADMPDYHYHWEYHGRWCQQHYETIRASLSTPNNAPIPGLAEALRWWDSDEHSHLFAVYVNSRNRKQLHSIVEAARAYLAGQTPSADMADFRPDIYAKQWSLFNNGRYLMSVCGEEYKCVPAEETDRIVAALAAEGSPKQDYTAWLLEREVDGQIQYLQYEGGSFTFTPDANLALHFARRIDGDRVGSECIDGLRIVEHIFPEVSVPSPVSDKGAA